MSIQDDCSESRRDFADFATDRAGTVATNAADWPLVRQMYPRADVLALYPVGGDVMSVQPGTTLMVKWQGKPVFIQARTNQENKEARALSEHGVWLVRMGLCTDLGCAAAGTNAGLS